jgi:hypothetical protein
MHCFVKATGYRGPQQVFFTCWGDFTRAVRVPRRFGFSPLRQAFLQLLK